MKIFGNNDTVFARATAMGKELFNVRLSGVGSMTDLMAYLIQTNNDISSPSSLVCLTVRNMTQGWTQTSRCRI